MRTYAPFNVLLVDDEPSTLDSVQALLAESQPAVDAQADLFQLRHVERLSLGLDVLEQSTSSGDRQVVLLDLNLPDSQGIATVEKMRRAHPEVPVIVLTGVNDEVVAVQVIESGAQGFLSKDNLDPNLLAYALLLAADRQRRSTLFASSSTAAASQWLPDGTYPEPPLAEQTEHPLEEPPEEPPPEDPPRQTEIENFERLANSVRPATVTSMLFESGLLKEAVPDIFEQMVETYLQILDQAMEQKMFRVEHPISDQLRSLAQQLGFLKAGARDVVELHTLALKQKTEQENAMKARAYAAEGRLIVLELMGYLTTYYRKYFVGLSKLNAAKSAAQNAAKSTGQNTAKNTGQNATKPTRPERGQQ